MSNQASHKTFFGHPFQLSSLFHIELWERFSFYGMQSILLYYLYYETSKGGLGIDVGLAGKIVAAYSGSIYLSTIFGGWLSDRLLGAEKVLFYSGITVMSGHIVLAVFPSIYGLELGLLLIALGSGGVKASASSMVGSLYEAEELRPLRDAGFSLFYLSINIGGFLGPLFTGLLQDRLGFHYGFGVAAIGMAIGLFKYSIARRSLPASVIPNPLAPSKYKWVFLSCLAVISAIIFAIANGWLTANNISQALLIVIILATLTYFMRLLGSTKTTAQNKRHIMAYLPLFIGICIFWAIWYQVYTAVAVYFESVVDRNIGGFVIPPAWMTAMQSFWVIMLSGLMATMWTKMGERQPKTPIKFSLSLITAGIAYLLFFPYVNGSPMPIFGIVLVLLLLTIAELLLSPISLSFATKIAPEDFKTQMVALNFLSLSLGMTLGGVLFKQFYQEENIGAFFQLLVVLGVTSGGILFVISKKLNNLLKEID